MAYQYNSATFGMDWVPDDNVTYNPLPSAPSFLDPYMTGLWNSTATQMLPHMNPGDGSFTPAFSVYPEDSNLAASLGSFGTNTAGMSRTQMDEAANAFLNNSAWWNSPEAKNYASQSYERGNAGNLWADTLGGALQVGGAALGINSLFGSGLGNLFSGASSGAGAGVDLGGGIWGGAADSLGGMPLTGGISGASSAAGSGAMDFSNLGDLWNYGGDAGGGWNPLTDGYGMGDVAGGSSLSDLQAAADQFGWSDMASPGTSMGANADIGGSSWLNTLWEQAKANPLGTAGQVLKSVTGSSSGTDWMKMLGSLGAAGLGAYASNQQTNSLEAMAGRYEGYGAPYRQRLSDLYADPTSFLQSNEVQKPVQMGTDNLMRSLSMQGNPFGSGNALQQGQSYASDQLFGKLGQEKDRLAGFGGLSAYNQAAPQAATNAIQSGNTTYQGIAKTAGDIFNPPQTPAQQAAEWMKVMGR